MGLISYALVIGHQRVPYLWNEPVKFSVHFSKKLQTSGAMRSHDQKPPLHHFRVYHLTEHGEMKVKSDLFYCRYLILRLGNVPFTHNIHGTSRLPNRSCYSDIMMRNRQRGSDLGLLLLACQVFQLGIDNIPPVTLATLGLNVYLFLFPAKPLLQTCLSVQEAYWYRDWRRLLLSPFHHVDDMHLYFNMASLLWKGINLERKLGGAWFAYLLSVFSLLTGLVYLLLETGLTHMTEDSSYSLQCAVGFSGVLFGLKVVNNHYHPGGVKYIMGLLIANRYACWVELVLIHIMNPGTSFVGHLAGILVGLLYTTGPLKRLMKTCAGFVTSNGHYGGHQTYYNSSGYSGYGMPYPPNPHDGQQSFSRRQYGAPYRQPYDTAMPSAPSQHPYTAGLSEEEQYAAAVRASLNDRGSHTRGTYTQTNPTPEEIRWRRLQRFNSRTIGERDT